MGQSQGLTWSGWAFPSINVILFLHATHAHMHTQTHIPHRNQKHSFPPHLLWLP